MPAPDFRLYHGNDLELLAGLLAEELARPVPGRPLLEPDTILVPQPAVRRWLQKTLAERHGVAANLRFLAPGEFVRQLLDANVPATGVAAGDASVLRWRLWRELADPDRLRTPAFAPLAPALVAADPALAAWQLAGALAQAFDKYQAWRRDWLLRWDKGADRDDWQAELWRRATKGLAHRARRRDTYFARLGDDGIPTGVPARVFAFACQNVSPDVLRALASAGRAGPVHFYFVSPVRGWWGDLRTLRERLRHDEAFDDGEHPLLRANGAAGRDFVRTLFGYEVVHPSFEQAVYVGPDAGTRTGLLHRIQRDLLERAPPRSAGLAAEALADASLQVHACHTRLREVQVLHDRIRDLLEADPSLQPREIAVLAPDLAPYAPLVDAVFGGEARHAIPYTLADGLALARRPAARLFAQLLDLPRSPFGAEEILDLLAQPLLAERFDLAPRDFAHLRGWLAAAGARWGLDGAHRATLDAAAAALS
jgi:exodeoxyribonuclease V gamma subunit